MLSLLVVKPVKLYMIEANVCNCFQVNWSKDDWILEAKLTGKSFSGPGILKAVAGQVTDYPLRFMPVSEGVVEVLT